MVFGRGNTRQPNPVNVGGGSGGSGGGSVPVTGATSPASLPDAQALAPTNVTLSSPGATFDSVTFSSAGSDRVFLLNQSTPSQNGVWVWNGAASSLTRPADFASALVLTIGKTIRVENGTVYGNTTWALNASTGSPITVDTTSQTWTGLNPSSGTFWNVGSGAPTSGIGLNGEMYLDDSSFNVWGPKATGAWPSAPTTAVIPNFGGLSTTFITSRWYPGSNSVGTAVLTAQNSAYAMPMPVNKTHTFVAIGFNVTVIGSTGGTVRLGIYADNGSGYPGALVLDAGTVAVATGTGAKTITISQTLTPGLYWLVAAPQGGTTQPTITTVAAVFIVGWFGCLSPGTGAGNEGWTVGSVSGALPGTFPTGGSVAGANAMPFTSLQA